MTKKNETAFIYRDNRFIFLAPKKRPSFYWIFDLCRRLFEKVGVHSGKYHRRSFQRAIMSLAGFKKQINKANQVNSVIFLVYHNIYIYKVYVTCCQSKCPWCQRRRCCNNNVDHTKGQHHLLTPSMRHLVTTTSPLLDDFIFIAVLY